VSNARSRHAHHAVGDQVRHDLIEYGVAPSEKITVIPLGPSLRSGRRTLRGSFKQELGLAETTLLVGIEPDLHQSRTTRSSWIRRAVTKEIPDARFLIVGDGVLRVERAASVWDWSG
jgi:hypothetical protein